MAGLVNSGFANLRDFAKRALEELDNRKLSRTVHTAVMKSYEQGYIPSGGGAKWSDGTMRKALLNDTHPNHFWRWNTGKFVFGLKGGPRYGNLWKDKGTKNYERTSKSSRGPGRRGSVFGDVARSLEFQGHRLKRKPGVIAQAIQAAIARAGGP
jgi:hypothetical protein